MVETNPIFIFCLTLSLIKKLKLIFPMRAGIYNHNGGKLTTCSLNSHNIETFFKQAKPKFDLPKLSTLIT